MMYEGLAYQIDLIQNRGICPIRFWSSLHGKRNLISPAFGRVIDSVEERKFAYDLHAHPRSSLQSEEERDDQRNKGY